MVIALDGSVCCDGESETMQNEASRMAMKNTNEKVLRGEIGEKSYLCCNIHWNSTYSKVTMRKIIEPSIIYQIQNNKITMKNQYILKNDGGIYFKTKVIVR